MNMNESEHLLPDQQSQKMAVLASVINVGLKVLSLRLLTILALLLSAGLFGWAMYIGGWDRLAIAAVFTVGAWAILNLRFYKENRNADPET